MSAAVLAPMQPTVQAPGAGAKAESRLGRGAVRTYSFLLNEGGWWAVREMSQAFELTGGSTLSRQLRELLDAGHIARRGNGKAGTPYEFGVLTTCVPVPGVTLQQAAV